VIELLELQYDSVVLDIGGGSPVTGAGFFASLLAPTIKQVIVFDDCVSDRIPSSSRCQYIKQPANYLSLKALLDKRDDITHVASISVFEHVDSETRQGVVQAINESIHVQSFVATFEYHPRTCYFEHQLTARTLSDLTSSLDNFYLDSFDASPVWCENAFDTQRFVKLSTHSPLGRVEIPRWHPIALRFLRSRKE
jgi:hypothetical protein